MLQHLCLDHAKCSQGSVGTLPVRTCFSYTSETVNIVTIVIDIHSKQRSEKQDVIMHVLPQKNILSYCRRACEAKLRCISFLLLGSDNTENMRHACSKASVG